MLCKKIDRCSFITWSLQQHDLYAELQVAAGCSGRYVFKVALIVLARENLLNKNRSGKFKSIKSAQTPVSSDLKFLAPTHRSLHPELLPVQHRVWQVLFFANILWLWVSSNHAGTVPIFEMRISNGFGNTLHLFNGNRGWEVISMQNNRRSYRERRTGRDRRRFFSFKGLSFKRQDRRISPERRSNIEVRVNWIRVSKWASAPLNHLKISKYLLGKTNLTKNDPKSAA